MKSHISSAHNQGLFCACTQGVSVPFSEGPVFRCPFFELNTLVFVYLCEDYLCPLCLDHLCPQAFYALCWGSSVSFQTGVFCALWQGLFVSIQCTGTICALFKRILVFFFLLMGRVSLVPRGQIQCYEVLLFCQYFSFADVFKSGMWTEFHDSVPVRFKVFSSFGGEHCYPLES